ncbi:hypothetical protein [Aurantiacibacter hainanensis]|uniref:hypothetical protein n=1 Tax=Aurantiacibacter hainanensis TaxID=3076114 RepID=UPI0030C67E49
MVEQQLPKLIEALKSLRILSQSIPTSAYFMRFVGRLFVLGDAQAVLLTMLKARWPKCSQGFELLASRAYSETATIDRLRSADQLRPYVQDA